MLLFGRDCSNPKIKTNISKLTGPSGLMVTNKKKTPIKVLEVLTLPKCKVKKILFKISEVWEECQDLEAKISVAMKMMNREIWMICKRRSNFRLRNS
jgi:hypothetical protein